MPSRDELPTGREMFEEILDLITGLGVMLLPALILAVPGLILLLPLALPLIPLAILAAPFLLIRYLVRLARRPRTPTARSTAPARAAAAGS